MFPNRNGSPPRNGRNSNATINSPRAERLRSEVKAAAADAAKKPLKKSVLQDIIALNKSVGIEEENARDTQIKALRQSEVPQLEGLLKEQLVGLPYERIEGLVIFKVNVLNPGYLREGEQASFEGNIKSFRLGAEDFLSKISGKEVYHQVDHSIRVTQNNRSSAISFSLSSSDPLSSDSLRLLRNFIEDEKLSSEDKWRNISTAKLDHLAIEIVNRYRELKVTDSYKVTCLALELEVISEQIDCYKKDLKEVFELNVPRDIIVDPTKFVKALTRFNNSEEIGRLTREFNEKVSEFLVQRNEIEKIQIQNYDKLTSAQKNPSIQKFKSEILSEAQFNEIFDGITLSGIQFEALREIESILINPESRSKPLVSFNMGEGKTFLIELVKKYAEVIERDKGGEEYRQLGLDEKQEAVVALEFQVKRHKDAIKAQKRGQVFNKEGTSVPLAMAKTQLKLLEDQLGKIRREVNQTRLRGLTIEIIDRANEAEKLRDLNAKIDLRNTFIFWDESRYGLQESSDIRLGSQLRRLKDKKANLVLVGATVNEIKLVEAVNRARDKGKTKQRVDKVEHDLKEFRKRKVRAINKISESDIEKETAAFAQKWAEIVKKNHGDGVKKSQHVFLDLKLEIVSPEALTDGLRKIITGAGAPEIAMVNFIRNGEYRCLIAKKGRPDQIINTKVGNRDYYKAILQNSSAISFAGQDRELTAAEINTIKLLPFVDNIAQIYGERYSIGGVYDKVDVLQTDVDSQILYASKAEKINLAEIGQAQSRNRNSKPLKGKIVIQGNWVPQGITANGLAEMALKNFEHRDLAEFVEDLDSKMTKYFYDGQIGRKCSEVLLDITISDEEKVKIIGGDTVLMMQKFSSHIENMESDVKHKFIRDVKLFIHYSSLLNVRLSEPRNPHQRAEGLMLNYAPLLSDDYQYEFDEALLSQSSVVLNSGSRVQQASRPINILQANEQFIDHFSRLTYSKKTEACLKREREEAETRAKEEKRIQKLRDAEEKQKQALALEELRRQQEEADNLERYLNGLKQESENARMESIRLEQERAKLLQQTVEHEVESRDLEVEQSEITASLLAQLESVNKRIAEKRASEAELLSQKEEAESKKHSVDESLRRLEGVIDVTKGRDTLLAKIRDELRILSDESKKREKELVRSEKFVARMASELEALKIECEEEKSELDVVIAASDKKSEQILAITESIKSSNDQIQELYYQQIECGAKISSFLKQKELLEEQNKALKIGLEKAEKHSAALEDRFGELELKEEKLQENLLQAQEKAKELLQDKVLKQEEFQELESTNKVLTSEIHQARQDISSLQGKISEIEQLLNSNGAINQRYEQLVEELSNEISELELSISAETSLLEESKEEARKKLVAKLEIEGELSTVIEEQEALATEKEALEKQIEKAREDHAQKTSQKDAVVKSVLEVQQESAELGEQLSIFEKSLREKNQALKNARQEGAELRSTLAEAQRQIEDLEKQIDSSRIQLAILEEEVSAKSQKIASITRGIESIAQEMEDIKQRVSAEEDIEKRTALTVALLEKIEEKQRELESSEVSRGVYELYSAKLRELEESLNQSFIEAGIEQERVRQERDLKRDLEKQQLIETFHRDLESQIKDLTEVQSEKDLVMQQRIEEMTRENEVLRGNLLQKERLIDSENLLKRQMEEKEIEIAKLKEAALQQEMTLRKLEEDKILFERIANDAKDSLEEKVSLDAVNQSEQDSLLSRNLFLKGEIDKQKEGFDRQTRDLRAELETLEETKFELNNVKAAKDNLERQIEELGEEVRVVREKEKEALTDLQNMRSELEQVHHEKSQLAIQIQENTHEYDQVKERLNREYEELQSSLVEMQQQHDRQIQILENTIEELQSHQPEPDMEQVIDLESQLGEMRKKFSAQQENLQHQIRENEDLQQRVVELTATKSKELEAPESRGKKGPAKVNMELAQHALAEQIRVLKLDPEALRKERSNQHVSELTRKHVINGFKYDADEVTQIVAPITPSVLSLSNYYREGNLQDQRYYYIEFARLTFQEEPKTAEGKLGIFNDAVLYKAIFRNCKFHSIDFSRIDPKIFGTIEFNKACTFDGYIQLPEGFTLKDGKIEKSEEAEIPKSTITLRATPPVQGRSSEISPRVNTHAHKPATFLGSTGGRGRGRGGEG